VNEWGWFLVLMALLGLVVLLSLSSSGSEAKEIVVDEEGAGDYRSLSSALSHAEAGDTIIVKEGNYTENYLSFFKGNITIAGESNETTRIHTTHFYLSVENSTLENCNITGSGNSNELWFSSNARNCTLSNCSIFNFQGGVRFSYSTRDISFQDNTLWNTTLHGYSQNLEKMSSYRLYGNTINGRPLHYLRDSRDKEFSAPAAGFILVNCTNITLSGVEISSTYRGIFVYSCSGITIEGCQIDSKEYSILVVQSDFVHILDNTVRRLTNDHSGYLGTHIETWLVSRLQISRNHVIDGGISVQESGGARILDNVLEGEGGIILHDTASSEIVGNTMTSGGITFWKDFYVPPLDPGYYLHTFSDNHVGEKPIYYYVNRSDRVVPDDAGQVILVNCRSINARKLGNTTETIPFLLYNTTDSHISDSWLRLRLVSSDRNRVENCTARGTMGMELMRSQGNTIVNNNCSGNAYSGIFLQNSHENSIINNNCSENDYTGVFLQGSNHTTVRGNQIFSNEYRGISLQDVKATSITGNNISGNEEGIHLWGHCKEVEISYNNIYHNTAVGLRIEDSKNTTIDASYNWWGKASGPEHYITNPDGKGDVIVGEGNYSPWLKEETDGIPVEEKEEADHLPLYILLISILCILILLVVVVRLPDDRFRPGHAIPGKDSHPEKEQVLEASQPTTSCPHCGRNFDVGGVKRPVRFTCHFCGNEVNL